jgi:hypothetical protein
MMKKAAVLFTVLGLAACNSQPASPLKPRVPRVTAEMSKTDPSLLQKYLPICQSIAANGTQTQTEYTRCRLINADERLRQVGAKIRSDANKIHGF